MKRKNLYQILPYFMVGICVAGMCLTGTRIFAKKVLIGKLGIENYVTCMLADYNWGDRLERRIPQETDEAAKPERLRELEALLEGAPKPETKQAADEADSRTPFAKISDKVFAAEDDITKYSNDKFLLYNGMRGISHGFDKLMGWELAYARENDMTYTLHTGFDYRAVEEKDVTEYTDSLLQEHEIAENAGTDFLYVQYPYRVDCEKSQVPWGAAAEENANADAVLKRLQAAGADTLDLREALTRQGWSYDDGFYMTDGHWTTHSGFLSAGIVADYLNRSYDFAYDEAYFDEKNYDVRSYSLNNYAVKEEAELFLPAFDTDLQVLDAYRGESYEGTFEESCFDMAKADTEEYSSVLTAYSASRIRNSYLFEYQNRKKVSNQKRLLVSSDSFSWHLLPYLALDTEYVDYVYKMTPEQMEYYVEKLQPDMVIILERF